LTTTYADAAIAWPGVPNDRLPHCAAGPVQPDGGERAAVAEQRHRQAEFRPAGLVAPGGVDVDLVRLDTRAAQRVDLVSRFRSTVATRASPASTTVDSSRRGGFPTSFADAVTPSG
jgi:hypothetical protein